MLDSLEQVLTQKKKPSGALHVTCELKQQTARILRNRDACVWRAAQLRFTLVRCDSRAEQHPVLSCASSAAKAQNWWLVLLVCWSRRLTNDGMESGVVGCAGACV